MFCVFWPIYHHFLVLPVVGVETVIHSRWETLVHKLMFMFCAYTILLV